MNFRHLHIVSFDVPFPANYGGVIDVYYKVRALHEAGIKVHLHCFEYGRDHSKELNAITEKVFYYKRRNFLSAFSSKPFIVHSRTSEELKHRLLQDNEPILLEGLHTCELLGDKRFKDRKIIYRESNIEHEYYINLAKAETNLFKKLFFLIESRRLKRFEPVIAGAKLVLCVSENDTDSIRSRYPALQTEYLPSFHPEERCMFTPEKEDFVLYHGNLAVAENHAAAVFLIEKVFSGGEVKLVIAGRNPSSSLTELVLHNKNVSLIENPSNEKLNMLISKAQVNVLFAFHSAGLKLKLLHVLFRGGHCLVSPAMVAGTGLSELCVLANSPMEFRTKVNELRSLPFNEHEMERREKILFPRYANSANAMRLISLLKEI